MKMKPEVTHGKPTSPAAKTPAAGIPEQVAPMHPSEEDAVAVATSADGQAALAKLEADNADLKDRLLRALAEVENVRRRAERDLLDARQYAVTNFARDMVGVADNLERALANVPAEAREGVGAIQTLVQGVELTEKEMQRSLEKHGVKKLIPVGERFDPHFHEALFERPDPTVPTGTVTQVVSPGYSIGTRALRPATVGVASGANPA